MDVPFRLPVKERYKPISGYGVIGNTKTAALVGYDGSIDWCCFPRFDSASVFAALLDWRKGGRWTITPAKEATSTQSYLPDTNILRTEFECDGSKVTLTDFMPCSRTEVPWSALPEIHRIVKCTQGRMKLRFLFDPAFDYGRTRPRLLKTPRGISMRERRWDMALAWSEPFPMGDGEVDVDFDVKEGEERFFVLSYGEAVPRKVADYKSEAQRARTEFYWTEWVSHLRYSGSHREIVIRSALTLKLLTYSPTGAIVAAPTTSLPEVLGGTRNWDYRYSWIRDSANSLWAFSMIGSNSEAESYLHWLIQNNPALEVDLRLMYDVNGGTQLPETTLGHLEGYRCSRPVRIGNAASEQLQFDTYGYMLDALYFSTEHGKSVSEDTYFRFVKPLADFIADTWQSPSHSIWEMRERRNHFVYTKAWAYAGLVRAIDIARATGHEDDVPAWSAAKKAIKSEVLRKGWSSKRHSFVMNYGGEELDAANLLLPLMGFLRADAPKMKATIEAIQNELADGALVYRTRSHREEGRKEGAFLLCSFWLVSCLAALGRVDEATRNFDDLVSRSNHLGLYAEEIDPKTGEALGNFPQAFSHLGVIIAANSLETAGKRKKHRN
jgi:GH15 family glucan-1,4-alpha-glucosidase